MPRGRKKLLPLDHTMLDSESYIDVVMAKRLIAQEVVKPGESLAKARDRVRRKFEYDVAHGKVPWRVGWKVKVGPLIYWARKIYPGKFIDWPGMRPLSGSFDGEYSLAASWRLPVKLPTTVNGCHELLAEQQEVIEVLQRAISKCRKKIAAVENKRRIYVDEQRVHGRKGGRGNIKEN